MYEYIKTAAVIAELSTKRTLREAFGIQVRKDLEQQEQNEHIAAMEVLRVKTSEYVKANLEGSEGVESTPNKDE